MANRSLRQRAKTHRRKKHAFVRTVAKDYRRWTGQMRMDEKVRVREMVARGIIELV